MIRIKKGNTRTLILTPLDADGEGITDLADVTEVYFMVKNSKTDDDDDALISVSETGGEITIDDPETGQITIDLNSTDTSITPGSYYFGIQLKYASSTVEAYIEDDSGIYDTLSITQDIVRGS